MMVRYYDTHTGRLIYSLDPEDTPEPMSTPEHIDALSPARGLFYGILFGAAIWAVLIAIAVVIWA